MFGLFGAKPIKEKTLEAIDPVVFRALDLANGNIMVANSEFDIVYVNDELMSFFREYEESIRRDLPVFSAEGIVGKNIDIFHKNPAHQRELLKKLEHPYSAVIQVGEVQFQLNVKPLLGEKGQRIATFVLWSDARKANEHKSQVAAINRSQAVIHFNMEGIVLDANEKFLDVMGYSLDEIQGKHHRIFCDEQFVQSADYTKFWQQLKQGSFMVGQYLRIGKNGQKRWIEASYNPIFDMNGKPYMVTKFATDMTPRKEANRQLASDFEKNVKALVETVAGSSEHVRETATGLSSSAVQTETQSITVDRTTLELSKSINEISSQVTSAVDVVARTTEKVQTTKALVANLVNAANKVSEVTALISVIANQTNLLALNATIEAARAGDAGKGFAVVASEVKNLAKETSDATSDINLQIQAMQKASRQAAQAIDEIPLMMEEISQISSAISSAIEEQSAATGEVSYNINGVLGAAKETGSHASALLQIATELASQCTQLQERVGSFLTIVSKM